MSSWQNWQRRATSGPSRPNGFTRQTREAPSCAGRGRTAPIGPGTVSPGAAGRVPDHRRGVHGRARGLAPDRDRLPWLTSTVQRHSVIRLPLAAGHLPPVPPPRLTPGGASMCTRVSNAPEGARLLARPSTWPSGLAAPPCCATHRIDVTRPPREQGIPPVCRQAGATIRPFRAPGSPDRTTCVALSLLPPGRAVDSNVMPPSHP